MTYSVADLMWRVADGERLKFVFFWGHTKNSRAPLGAECFSQWHDSSFAVDSVVYRTAEHFMMASKARLFGDFSKESEILAAKSPAEAKKLGRSVAGFDEAVWRTHRNKIVVDASVAKFSQHAALGNYLKGTGNRVLVEASPTDLVWGVGLSRDHAGVENPANWRGLNLLGFALMEARDVLAARLSPER